jgi:hypothetical protein
LQIIGEYVGQLKPYAYIIWPPVTYRVIKGWNMLCSHSCGFCFYVFDRRARMIRRWGIYKARFIGFWLEFRLLEKNRKGAEPNSINRLSVTPVNLLSTLSAVKNSYTLKITRRCSFGSFRRIVAASDEKTSYSHRHKSIGARVESIRDEKWFCGREQRGLLFRFWFFGFVWLHPINLLSADEFNGHAFECLTYLSFTLLWSLPFVFEKVTATSHARSTWVDEKKSMINFPKLWG